MSEREQIENAIAKIEQHRAALGDEAATLAIAALRAKLASLVEDDERKLVTIMFADLSGFTALAEKSDPETVRKLVNACFERFAKIVAKYQGTIEKFIGDEIMVMFGAPISHEDDPERAVRTALDMMSELERFNRERHTTLGMHIGVNTGLVLAGSIGAGGQQQYGVTGDAVNLAARLKIAAPQGQILIGHDTHRVIASLFVCEALEPIRVKGKSEVVQAYRVIGLKTERGRGHGLEARGIGSPLVGRDAELVKTKMGVENLLRGRGGIISLIGEAGLGKSRLLAEVRNWAMGGESPLQWFEGRTLSYGEHISYWTIQDLLKSYGGIDEDDSEDDAWGKLAKKMMSLFNTDSLLDVMDVLPYLASLLAINTREIPTDDVLHAESEALGRKLYAGARKFFAQLAQGQPTVLVFEDLHWIDEASSLLIEHLISLVDDVPLLFILVTRPVPNPAGARIFESALRGHADLYSQVRLYPLTPAEGIQLMRNLVDVDALTPRGREMIVDKADGNPFYMEEVIRALIDTGAVVRDEARGRWVATSQIESLTLPDTIQGVIMTRVDRLDDHAKEVLRTAAVIGRSFSYRVLTHVIAAVAASPTQIDDHLNELREIDLIREKRRTPELEFAFNHALAHDAIYQSLVLQKRRDLHARVGEAIELLFADKLDEFYGVLAYHFAHGEVWTKAQEYLLKAGDQAGQLAADADALTYYQQALAAYGDKLEALQRAMLERKIGEVFLRRGEHGQALAHFHRALSHLGKSLPRSAVSVNAAIAAELIEQVINRLTPTFLRDIRLLGDSTPLAREEARLYENLGWMEAFNDQRAFLLLGLKLLNVSERNYYHRGVAIGASSLGAICDFAGRFRLARRYHEQSVRIAIHTKDPTALALAYYQRFSYHFMQCHWAEAIEDATRASEFFSQLGLVRGQGLATFAVAMTHYYRGEFLRVMAQGRELITLGLNADDSQVWSWGLFVEAMARARIGATEEAQLQLEQAIELAEAIPDHFTLALAHAEMLRCFLRQDELGRVQTEMSVLPKIAVERSLVSNALTPLRNNYAEACLSLAEKDRTQESLMRARGACEDALKRRGAFKGGEVEAQRLRGVYEWLNGKHDSARKWWARSLKLSDEYKMPYEKALTLFEMGKRLKDAEMLRAAKWLFESLDAEGDFERVKRVVGLLDG